MSRTSYTRPAAWGNFQIKPAAKEAFFFSDWVPQSEQSTYITWFRQDRAGDEEQKKNENAETLRSHCYYVLRNCVKFNLHKEIKRVSSLRKNHITYNMLKVHFVHNMVAKKMRYSRRCRPKENSTFPSIIRKDNWSNSQGSVCLDQNRCSRLQAKWLSIFSTKDLRFDWLWRCSKLVYASNREKEDEPVMTINHPYRSSLIS